MTEWIVKEKGYVPLPLEHVLRKGVDWLYWAGEWQVVDGLEGVTVRRVVSQGYTYACCRVEDWPDELGPVPQEPESEPEFRVELGKRYVSRCGDVSGVIERTPDDDYYRQTHPFRDPVSCETFTESGRLLLFKESELDLISEYREPAVSTEPQPGQWWVSKEGVVWRCAAITDDGDAVMMDSDRFLVLYSELQTAFNTLHHEPRCTGFDWAPPEQEQPSEPAEDAFTRAELQTHCDMQDSIIENLELQIDAHKRLAEEMEGRIAELRSQCERQAATIESLQAQIESDRRWIESLHEQIARLTAAPPSEDPEEWVVQNRVPFRNGIDRGWWVWNDGDMAEPDKCWSHGHNSEGKRHGDSHVDGTGSILSVRCRRKDLPPIHEEDPEEWVVQDRVPMRDCDQRRWVNPVSMDVAAEWAHSAITSVDPAIHGAVNRGGNRLELRCRRKDLPVIHEEDPDGWVVQDRVPSRPGIDEWRVVLSNGVATDWQKSCAVTVMHNHGDNYVRFEIRCRRKDLPPLPETSPEPPKTRTIPMAVVLVSHDEVQWIEARVSMRDGKPDVPDADAKVRIVEEYTREISVGE